MTSSITEIAVIVVPVLIGVLGFFLKMWVNRILAKIDKLEEKVTSLLVADARNAGSVDLLAKSIERTHGDVAKLSGSVTKLWDTLQARNLSDSRLSDKFSG